MASDKLKQFVLENFNWGDDSISEDDLVTEVVIMYRTVKMTGDTPAIPERVDFVSSDNCAFTTAVAMVEWTSARLGHFMEKVIFAEEQADEEDEDGEEQGI